MYRLFYCLLLLSGFFHFAVIAQDENSFFDLYDLSSGLSNNQVTAITQTNDGMIWVGTRDGLNMFDGYTFKKFKADTKNPDALKDNDVREIFTDSKGRLWVGFHLGGLALLNRDKLTFRTFLPDENNRNSVLGKTIGGIVESTEGEICIGTENGISIYDPDKDLFTNLSDNFHKFRNDGGASTPVICDNQGFFWAGAGTVLYRIDPKNPSLMADFWATEDEKRWSEKTEIFTLACNNQGLFFVGTTSGIFVYENKKGVLHFVTELNEKGSGNFKMIDERAGLLHVWGENTLIHARTGSLNGFAIINFEYKNGVFDVKSLQHTKVNLKNPNGLSHNRVRAVFRCNDGTIWIGTENGLNKYSNTKNKFEHFYNYRLLDPEGFPSNEIRDIIEENDEKLWVAIYGFGVVRFNPKNQEVMKLPVDFKAEKIHRSRQMLHLPYLKTVLVCTSAGGVYGLDTETGRLKVRFNFTKDDSTTIPSNTIAVMYRDNQNYVWFGGENGLAKVFAGDLLKGKVARIPLKEEITTITQDEHKNYWLGTEEEGILIFDGEKILHKISTKHQEFLNNLPADQIKLIEKDESGNIWVGTSNGLAFYDWKSRNFEIFDEKIGLKNSTVNGLIQNKKSLWISTNDGLYEFDTEKKLLKYFSKEDGLQGNEFRKRCYHKGKCGYLYFGGLNGFNRFIPDKIQENLIPPRSILTGLEIFNELVEIDEKGILKADISTLSELTLSHKEYIFGFRFSALHFSNPSKNQFAYKLEGFDKDWIYTDANKRAANYSNIPAGEYFFCLKSANADGIWGEEVRLKLIITPPFWATWWFRAAVMGLLVFLAFSFYTIRTKALKKRNLELEMLVAQRTAEIEAQNEELEASLAHQQQLNAEVQKQKEEILVQNEEMQQTQEELMAQREFVDAQNKQLALAVKDIETAYNLVEEQNMRMTDSIRYAQKIQNALLTNERRLSRVFPENFVMYRAKDIVSGDFYWAAKTQKFRFAAVVDCTGHGVPGAFMSVIGNNFLNQIVFNENHLEPSAILESLNEKVVHALKQDENENNDGMHLALIRVEEKAPEHFEILFAGAKRPLYYSYKNEVCTLKGSRKDIGGAQNDEIRFENHLLEISSTETLYLTSDGFADQNNEARQKISSKKLVELLQKNTALPLREQKVRLENFFDNFRGEEPQRDDVTVIGIRI